MDDAFLDTHPTLVTCRSAKKTDCYAFQAQGLKRILTTYDKVLNQPDDQFIYLMWQRHPTKP